MKKQKNTKCSFKKKNTVSYQKGGVVPKQRMGVRNNPDGTHSTHKMAYAESDGKWYAYPTLFQNADSSWVELNDDNNWEAFDEAARRGELQEFKTEKEAKDYAAGNWKTKQNGGAVNPIYTHDPNDPRLQAYNDSLRLYKSSTKERNDYLDFVKKAGFDDSKIGEWSTDGYINTDKHNNIGAIFNGILKNSGGGFDRNPNNFDDVRYFNYYPTKYNGDIKVYEDSPTGKKLMQGYEQYKKPVQPYIYEELTRLPMINKLPVNINVQIPKTKLEISKNEQSGMPVYDRTNRNKNKQKLVGYTDFVKDENTGKFKPVFIPRHPQNEDEIEYDLTDIQQQLGKNVEIRDEPKYNLNVRTLQQGGLVNNTGYTNGTPTANNPYNIIPSNNITMNNVDMPLLGVPNNGNPQVMLPENNYIFPNADYVTEIPLNNNNQMDNNYKFKRKNTIYAQDGVLVNNESLDLANYSSQMQDELEQRTSNYQPAIEYVEPQPQQPQINEYNTKTFGEAFKQARKNYLDGNGAFTFVWGKTGKEYTVALKKESGDKSNSSTVKQATSKSQNVNNSTIDPAIQEENFISKYLNSANAAKHKQSFGNNYNTANSFVRAAPKGYDFTKRDITNIPLENLTFPEFLERFRGSDVVTSALIAAPIPIGKRAAATRISQIEKTVNRTKNIKNPAPRGGYVTKPPEYKTFSEWLNVLNSSTKRTFSEWLKRLNSAPPPFQYGGTASPYKRKTISYAQEGIEVPEHVSKARKVANIIKSVIPPITLNTAPIAGMMSAAVNYIDGLNTKRNELSNFRKNLTPVTSPNEFLGNNDMPMYYQVGGEITNNNINSNNEFSGYTSKDFNAPLNQSNVIAEDGEFIQFPDGSTTPIVGDSHSDPSGGEYLNLPENTKIFSKKLKADKDFSSEILNKKVNKKMSIADLAKKFNTDKEDKILNNTKTSSIEKQTASINKEKKIFKTNQIFEYQESLKQPQGNQLNFNNQPVFAQKGVKVLKGGYKGEGTEEDYNAGYSSQQVQDYMKFLQTEAIKRGYSGDLGDVSALQNLYFSELPEQVISNYFLETVPPTNQARRMYGLSGTPEEAQAQWKQQSPGTNEILKGVVDNIPGVRYPVVTTKEYDSLEELQEDINATGTPIYVPDGSEYPTIVKYNNADNQYLIPTLKKQSEGRIPYPSPRLDVNINSQRPTKPDLSPLTDLSKDKKGKDRFKKILKGAKDVFSGVSGMNDYLPEIIAAAQTLNKFPINVNKFQPKYISPQEMNIQAALNENYAQSQPLLQQQGFNPSVSNARTNQAAANLYGANNQMFQQKFNADAQNRQQVQQYNNQLENQANMMNLQRIDDFWNKMTQRQSNIEQDINNITNSAYRKSKQKQAERESIRLINQMMNNYNYSKGKGIQYDPETGQPITYNPNDLMQQMLMMQQQQELEKKRKAKEKEEKKKKAEGKD